MAFGQDFRTTGAPGWGRAATTDAAALDAGLRAYMLRVYNWMASGLLVTAIVAYAIANTGAADLFYNVVRTPRGIATQPTMLGMVAIFAPLAFVLVLSFGVNRMSKSTVQMLFWAFCAVMGASMANIFRVYVGTSVASTFVTTAGMFAAISLYGYTTKRDLTKLGSFMMMGLIGIIIASLVNMFVGSGMLAFVISVLGVVIFTGLTAYDTQRTKSMYYQVAGHGELVSKAVVLAALTLYLDFINMFLFILRLFGSGRD